MSIRKLLDINYNGVDEKIIDTIPHKSNHDSDKCINYEFVVDSEGEYKIGDKKLIIKPFVKDEIFVFPESTANFAYVDLSRVKMPLIIRNRRDGDIINPFGMSGSMKLKKYMNSKGVNRYKRDEILIMANAEEVLWVVGVGLSNKIAVTKSPTHVVEVL